MTINNKIQLPKDIDSFWSDNCFHGVTQTFNKVVLQEESMELFTEAKDEIFLNIYENFGGILLGSKTKKTSIDFKEIFREWESLEADFLNNRDIEPMGDEHIELMEDSQEYMLNIIDSEYMENLEWDFEKFAVSPFMARELRKRNEPVISNILDFENIWMRQTFGQLVTADWVIQDIYNSWRVFLADA
jgi:hypothetical protein|tara:strand:- start:81 stop:644 length:564 start_codon:yes stop_codon:yes gene_type:complete